MKNEKVQELIDKGYNYRTAYRMVGKVSRTKNENFDYDKETPKGEWV